MPLQVECIDDHNANEALEEVTLGGDMMQNTQPLSCGLLRRAWWKLGGGGEGQNPLSLCALQPDAPRSSRESVLKHSFLNPDADDLGFLFSEKIKCKYRL